MNRVSISSGVQAYDSDARQSGPRLKKEGGSHNNHARSSFEVEHGMLQSNRAPTEKTAKLHRAVREE